MTIIHVGLPIATAVKVAVSTVASTGSITRYSPEDHMHQGVNSAGMSNVGNTSGTTGVGPGRLVFAGGNNITLSQGTDATGSTVTISGAASGGVGFTAGMSNVGNTSGTTGVADRRLVFAGGNNITISQSLDAANSSGTITISAFNQTVPVLSRFANFPLDGQVGAGTNHGLLYLSPMLDYPWVFPGNMTFSTMLFNVTASHTNTSASTDAHSYTMNIGIYTVSGTSTLNMLYQASTTFGGAAASDMSSKYHGGRFLTLNSSQFSNSATNATTPSFNHGGLYYLGLIVRSGGTNIPMTIKNLAIIQGLQMSGTVGTSMVTATSMNIFPFMGGLSVTTAALPVSIHRSDINTTGHRLHWLVLENELSAF